MMFDHRERRPEDTLRAPTQPHAARVADATAESDEGVHWLLAAHEMLVETVLRGERSRGAPRYIEQFATASRVLLLIPASQPEFSRTIEFSRAARELPGLSRCRWRERHHHIGLSAVTVGRRTACLRAEFEGLVAGPGNDATANCSSDRNEPGSRAHALASPGIQATRDGFEPPSGDAAIQRETSRAHSARCHGARASDDVAAEGRCADRPHPTRVVRCVTVTSLEWLPHSLKPRSLSFAIYYDDDDIALSATLQPHERTPGSECLAFGHKAWAPSANPA